MPANISIHLLNECVAAGPSSATPSYTAPTQPAFNDLLDEPTEFGKETQLEVVRWTISTRRIGAEGFVTDKVFEGWGGLQSVTRFECSEIEPDSAGYGAVRKSCAGPYVELKRHYVNVES